MRRIELTVIAALAFLIAGLSGSAIAASTNNPRWVVCAKKAGGKYTDSACTKEGAGEFELQFLGEGEKQEIAAKTIGKQIFRSEVGNPIACGTMKLKSGSNVKGSKAPEPGTGEGTAEYGECEIEKSPECKINKEASKKAHITTKPLKELLAFETKAGAENEEDTATVTVIEPAEGKAFAEVELAGTGCPATEVVKIEGSAVVRNLKAGAHTEEHEYEAPEATITKFFVNKESKTIEKEAGLKWGKFKIPWIAQWDGICETLGLGLIIGIIFFP